MKQQLEQKLYQIDSVFFQHAIACKDGKENEMNTCMYFGCECGDGWFQPLKRLTQKISVINNIAKDSNIKFVCDQLKQKYGQLCVYYSTNAIDINTKIDQNKLQLYRSMVKQFVIACQQQCWNVCEFCGKDGGYNGQGLVVTSGWISRICKHCAQNKADKESEKTNHNPQIIWLKQGYEFLSLFENSGFKIEDNYYNSIIQAFCSIKDNSHKDLYTEIGNQIRNKKAPYLIRKIANAFGVHYIDNKQDYNLLKEIVKAKFTYAHNKKLLIELLQTEGKNISNFWFNHNNILGQCPCQACKDIQKKDLYAKILNEVREQLLKENKKPFKNGQLGYKDYKFYIYDQNNKETHWKKISVLQLYSYMQKQKITENQIRVIWQ